MPYRLQTSDTAPANAVIDTAGPQYGVAVRDIFSDARWTPAEPVRVRGWHDSGDGTAASSSETDFD